MGQETNKQIVEQTDRLTDRPGNRIKALPKMGLDSLGVAGLGEDLEKLIIGKEEETGKDEPLGLEVVFQTLLNLVQELVVLFEGLQKA